MMLYKVIISLFLMYRHLPVLRCYGEWQQCNFGQCFFHKPLPVYPPISNVVAREFILNAEVSLQTWPSHISGKIISATGSTITIYTLKHFQVLKCTVFTPRFYLIELVSVWQVEVSPQKVQTEQVDIQLRIWGLLCEDNVGIYFN